MARRDQSQLRRAALFEQFRPAAGPAVPEPDVGAAGLWRLAGLGGARPHRPAPSARPPRLAGSAAGAHRRGDAPGAETALSRFLSGGSGDRQSGPAVRAARRRCLSTRSAITSWCSIMPRATARTANRPAVVGTYRLLRQPLAEQYGGFYTAGEFDIGR